MVSCMRLLGRLVSGSSLGFVCSLAVFAQDVDVPLERYRDAQWPGGPPIGNTAGAAFLDYDGDGWIDFYIHTNGGLWRNEQGVTWTEIEDLDVFLPPTGALRYGASCGDYDNDGLPDIATEQRGNCFYFLKNLGGASFVEVASNPTIVIGQPCQMFAETACWADVDDDGDLDLWMTAYPDTVAPGSGGNRFWENLGPSGPNGAYQLLLNTEEAGLTNPPNVERPEGAQFCDADRDGDVDGFANHTIYQNRSLDEPKFVALRRGLTGLGFPSLVDEGACFFDYDMDGDQDLLVLYTGQRSRMWENQGDATFFEAKSVIEDPRSGATEGCSAEDWDLDGDLDLSTGSTFRRNLRVEGQRFLRIATHNIPDGDLGFPSLTWGDWDLDGDPDCIVANWRQKSYLYRNTAYGPHTPRSQNQSIRVRVVRDSPTIERGLETEFGATVELRVYGDTSGLVRRRFVASSHGYLQQSEYALIFALPDGPNPLEPKQDVYFDLLVDLQSLPSEGILRIDPLVNPALGGIPLAKLEEREITIFRSGKVRLNGVEHPPRVSDFSQRLSTTSPLELADPAKALPDPVLAPAPSWVVGVELDTKGAEGAVLVQELVLDGQLEPAIAGRDDFNFAVWDVTQDRARLVHAESLSTYSLNHRSFLPVSFRLLPNKRYRVVSRVTELRASPIAPLVDESVQTNGGFSYQDLSPQTGSGVKQAALDPAQVFLALRFRAPRDAPAPARIRERELSAIQSADDVSAGERPLDELVDLR